METLERDYTPKGVHFYYVYKALAHPELNHYVQPFTLQERLMHVHEAERRLGSRIPWLADSMSNELKHAFGDVPNAEFVIGPDGLVLRRRAWSDPEALRHDLEELVGPVEHPTSVADLDMPVQPPYESVARGIVPRLDRPAGMRGVRIQPNLEATDKPFYTKLRVEADRGVLTSGSGQLYIGFHLDPLYHMHWNNLAPPLQFEISAPDGVTVTPAQATAPDPEADADADPREFLLQVSGAGSTDEPLGVSVLYYACDDANTFCVPVQQSYTVWLQPDVDAGSTFGQRRGFGPGDRGRSLPGRARGDMRERLMRMDSNGDGLLTRDELPERMQQMFDRMDNDGDGALDASEIDAMLESMGSMGRWRRS